MIYPYPEPVFRYFSDLSKIPRGSGNTEGIRQWCLQTAEALGIPAYADEAGNVILRKASSEGYQAHTPVILQGHLDMVCAKLPDCPADMETEPPRLIWDAESVSADGTTLGGDDGIAIAYAFAVLERGDLPHPPLTVILTNDEETGMDGANGLSPDELTGGMLINLDSEDEGILTVGCAGGVRVHLNIPIETASVSGTAVSLTLSGLTGGHSGTEIAKSLMNANLAMAELLSDVSIPFRLSDFTGGIRDNAIPTECSVSLFCSPRDSESLCQCIESSLQALKASYPTEEKVLLSVQSVPDSAGTALTESASAALLQFLKRLPNGVQEMNNQLQMPETSLNIGVVRLQDGCICTDALIRSGINAKKDALADRLCELAESQGGTAERSGSYSAWEHRPDSRLERTALQVYKRLFGTEMTVETIHAGLECGILSAKKPGLQCISIGPDLYDVHTPRERLSIASAARTWDYLTALLAAL